MIIEQVVVHTFVSCNASPTARDVVALSSARILWLGKIAVWNRTPLKSEKAYLTSGPPSVFFTMHISVFAH